MSVRPTSPVLGVPAGMKQTGKRVDFKRGEFDLLIETKGYLLAWERSNECPCAPVTDETEQPDPNCTLCNGSGWFYTGNPETQDLSDYEFTDLQQSILDANTAMVIRGVITRIEQNRDPVNQISNWVSGMMHLTVRQENNLSYYDKITALDSHLVFKEIVLANGTNTQSLRYKILGINSLRSVATEYTPDVDFELTPSGDISWLITPPALDTRLSVHYLCPPTWLVVNHPHAIRTSSILAKTASPKTPTGDAMDLPIQALVQYDFLPAP